MRMILLVSAIFAFGQASSAAPVHVATSGKSLDAFGKCFVVTQENSRRPWWFVPKGDGGTFSNAGARGSPRTYFARIQEARGQLSIELDADSPVVGASIGAAIDRCI